MFTGLPFRLVGSPFVLEADGRRYTADGMVATGTDCWRDRDVTIRLEHTTTPDGSRAVVLEASGVQHVHEVCLLDGRAEPAAAEVVNHVWFGAFDLPQQSTVL